VVDQGIGDGPDEWGPGFCGTPKLPILDVDGRWTAIAGQVEGRIGARYGRGSVGAQLGRGRRQTIARLARVVGQGPGPNYRGRHERLRVVPSLGGV